MPCLKYIEVQFLAIEVHDRSRADNDRKLYQDYFRAAREKEQSVVAVWNRSLVHPVARRRRGCRGQVR